MPYQLRALGFFEVLDHVTQENKIVLAEDLDQGKGIADVNRVIKKAMHRRNIRRMGLDTIELHLPVFLFITGRIMLSSKDVSVLPKKMSPFPEPDTDIENGLGLQLPDQVKDGGNGIGPAARHAGCLTGRG